MESQITEREKQKQIAEALKEQAERLHNTLLVTDTLFTQITFHVMSLKTKTTNNEVKKTLTELEDALWKFNKILYWLMLITDDLKHRSEAILKSTQE